MRIGIVGGTGNISRGFGAMLVDMGHEVTCINRGQLVDPSMLAKGVKHLTADRADMPAFEKAMQAQKFEAVIDMICFTKEQAQSSMRAFGGKHLKHFVHCSTVCTYGVDYDIMPVMEDHPLRPISDYGRNKVAADEAYMNAWKADGFPVTIIKPSTTYGPKMGALRQVAWEFSWIDRVRKGLPIVVCGDGNALHQFLHVDDAAIAFTHVIGREVCLGKTYNMMRPEAITWRDYHTTAMKVLGKEVELVGVTYADLSQMDVPAFDICKSIFSHHCFYSPASLMRDVPEFKPRIDLATGLARVIEAMDKTGRVPDASSNTWEDAIIDRQRRVRA